MLQLVKIVVLTEPQSFGDSLNLHGRRFWS